MRYEGVKTSGVLADLKIAFNKIREIFSNTKFFAMYAKTFQPPTRFVQMPKHFLPTPEVGKRNGWKKKREV
jgi:hypothetical protein